MRDSLKVVAGTASARSNSETRDEQKQVIFELADKEFSDYAIANVTRLSVEIVRQILAARVS